MSAHPYAEVVRRDLFARRRHPLLTDRQYECIELLAQGLTNREIAARLGISESSVTSHISRAMRKAGISDTTSRAGVSARRVRLVLWWLEQQGRLR